ncbi:hypothetical protein CEV34_2870 [Brucella pseudogrignonensis]|uniref:Uncharacterized protein n=1 Tax=Brucella pseudogrignonensis TaxID=419475 RepID=A0A256GDP9_9HYPH|nr:hypothetical protein CEV34_2870 [Brucella pseudogrignonensis]
MRKPCNQPVIIAHDGSRKPAFNSRDHAVMTKHAAHHIARSSI